AVAALDHLLENPQGCMKSPCSGATRGISATRKSDVKPNGAKTCRPSTRCRSGCGRTCGLLHGPPAAAVERTYDLCVPALLRSAPLPEIARQPDPEPAASCRPV